MQSQVQQWYNSINNEAHSTTTMKPGDIVILMSKSGTLRPPWYGKMGIIVSCPKSGRQQSYDRTYTVMIDGHILDISEQYLSKEFSLEENKSE